MSAFTWTPERHAQADIAAGKPGDVHRQQFAATIRAQFAGDDDAFLPPYSGLYADFSARVDHSIDLAKDLRWSQAEIDRLKREIKQLNWELVNAKRERDVTEARYEALRPPKQRTEADFRNADIDANGYVTFRDGGAA